MTQIMVLISLFLIPAYIFRFSIFGIPTNVFEISVLITFICFIVSWIRNRDPSPEPALSLSNGLGMTARTRVKFGYIAAYFILIFAAISIFVAADRTRALGIFKGWFLVPAILYFIIINTFDRQKIRRITIPLFTSLILVSIWATLQKLGVISTLFYQVGDSGFADYITRFRAFGPFESPNYLAMYLVPMMFITLPIFAYPKRITDKIFIVVLYLLPLYALYASHSLGGLLAFGFGAISILAFGLAKFYKAKIVNSGGRVTLLAVALVVVAVGFAIIFSSVGQETFSRSIRIDIYHYSIDLAKSHPIAGIGLGEFQQSVEKISASNLGFQLYGLSYALHPHNIFLAFWLYLGLFGFLSFLYLLGSFFWNLAKRGGDILFLSALFAAMVAIIIHGLVDTTYFKNDLSAIFWLILALGLIVGTKKNAEEK